ncbi:hypothetical protein C7W93_17985 [Glaciimonas sp. PCH181]|nr:hypothetical protein C7W93_17985 [Glaciimonas sp. PCH181]
MQGGLEPRTAENSVPENGRSVGRAMAVGVDLIMRKPVTELADVTFLIKPPFGAVINKNGQ